MGDECPSPNTILAATSLDSDFINELLIDGCWVETAEGDEFSSLLLDAPLTISLDNLPEFEAPNRCVDPISTPDKDTLVEPTEPSKFPRKRSLRYLQVEGPGGTHMQDWGEIQSNKRIWIGPKTNLSTVASVRERLMSAIRYLFESTGDGNILIQIWVPVKSGNKHVLTTIGQPYSVDTNSPSLTQYRNVCERYQFPAEENSMQSAGLPGRVFLRRVPEWTPDVRYFRQEEYPRIAYAQQLQVQGSLALPVFEQGSGSCLGVVEIVTTCQKINYRSELDTICKALEAFQLRSSDVTHLQSSKVLNDSYAAATPQINEFLAYACEAHDLPLAQTWALCTQHSNYMGSNSNFTQCLSTVDAAYNVGDQKFLGFHEECCEQHLFGDQGIVGKAFTTNQLEFVPDITTYSKTDYPLSHHAIMFGLCAAVAVCVRSIFTGSADFVLEFFLPVSCKTFEDQQQMISSLMNILQACQSLYIVTDNDLHEELLPDTTREDETFEKSTENTENNMMGATKRGKEPAVSSDSTKEFSEEFRMSASLDEFDGESLHEPVYEDFGFLQEDSKEAEDDVGISSTSGGNNPSGSRKSGENKRTKAEKHIDLHILQQYFAGTLKDASNTLGVCPTTLKRICRQHGINRWPSRKIKKVGHSLRKLQHVMDSVQGADIQISSFYSKFPELGSPNVSGASSSIPKLNDRQIQNIHRQEEEPLNPSLLKRPKDSVVQVNPQLKAGLISPTNTASKSQTQKPLPEQPPLQMLAPLQKNTCRVSRENGTFRLKVTFGELRVRFSLHHNWFFADLQQEIATRFNFDDISKFHLMYMDDDSEWVLLTCDADLEECLEIHEATQSSLIKLNVLPAPHTNLGTSFGSSALS